MRRVAVMVVVLLVACGKPERERPPAPAPEAPAPEAPAPRPPAPAPRPQPPPAPAPSTRPAPDLPAGLPTGTCVVHDVELVYVVDTANELWSFDPRKLPADPFHRVGHLGCSRDTRPFSMAVDRQGVAWVLYDDGRLYEASILDARCSQAVSQAGGDRPTIFGMGFVADGGKATTESLYVAARDYTKMFSRVDVDAQPPRWQPIAPIKAMGEYSPELTGTADGKLFGYFPEDGLDFVQELDRKTGQVIGPRRDLAGHADGGDVEAYAFAHWGGVFYVFATVGGVSAVHAIDRKTGAYHLVLDRIPQRIVGAGVSTCAPLLEQLP